MNFTNLQKGKVNVMESTKDKEIFEQLDGIALKKKRPHGEIVYNRIVFDATEDLRTDIKIIMAANDHVHNFKGAIILAIKDRARADGQRLRNRIDQTISTR